MTFTTNLLPGLEPFPGYRLTQLLGRGGFGEVWEAQCETGTCALKFIPAESQRVAAKEVQAIQNMRSLAHDNLIRVDHVWCNPGFVVVAMELADGSLLDLFQASVEVHQSPLPIDLVIDYLTQAARVLDYLNGRNHLVNGQRVGIQHCDVKPNNLLLCGETLKLSDFGLAAPTVAALRPHQRAGTLDFTAPEVFQGRLSNWTDQYALAVSYCQLRGGRLPFPTPRRFEVNYVRPDPDLTMLPLMERPFIARALAPIPQNRWPTCMEMMSRLAIITNVPLPPEPAADEPEGALLLDNVAVLQAAKRLESDIEI